MFETSTKGQLFEMISEHWERPEIFEKESSSHPACSGARDSLSVSWKFQRESIYHKQTPKSSATPYTPLNSTYSNDLPFL